jgi:hypothetical protein
MSEGSDHSCAERSFEDVGEILSSIRNETDGISSSGPSDKEFHHHAPRDRAIEVTKDLRAGECSSLERPVLVDFNVDKILQQNEETLRLRGFFRYDVRMKKGRKERCSPSDSMQCRNNFRATKMGLYRVPLLVEVLCIPYL